MLVDIMSRANVAAYCASDVSQDLGLEAQLTDGLAVLSRLFTRSR